MTKPMTDERLDEISYWFAKYPLQMRLQHHLPVRIAGLECTDEIHRLHEEHDWLKREQERFDGYVEELEDKVSIYSEQYARARELLVETTVAAKLLRERLGIIFSDDEIQKVVKKIRAFLDGEDDV